MYSLITNISGKIILLFDWFFAQTRYEVVDGEFQMTENFCLEPFDKLDEDGENPRNGSAGGEGPNKMADIYHIEIDVEIVLHVGIMPGCKVITYC